MTERVEVRQFISLLGPTLERAQAEGILARTKLDVRDQFEATINLEEGPQRAKSLSVFNEELEAFCADMRLAGVTVQHQVERHARRWLRGIVFGLLGAFGCGLLGLVVAGAGGDAGGGIGAILIFIGAPIAFFWLLSVGSRPADIAPTASKAVGEGQY
jgi:hypothetical protein